MKKIEKICGYLNELFPDAHCELNYETPYQLLIAVILSAQCTDKRVNMVTKDLFQIAPNPNAMLDLGITKLKTIIKPCGFYNEKAKSIIATSQEIVDNYNGTIPNTLNELTKLKGVGKKTANVVLAECFNVPTIPVDTHVLRISKRLGLTDTNSNPLKCEDNLMKIVKSDKRIRFHHQMIWFGRYFCKAQKPNCENCKLKAICNKK